MTKNALYRAKKAKFAKSEGTESFPAVGMGKCRKATKGDGSRGSAPSANCVKTDGKSKPLPYE